MFLLCLLCVCMEQLLTGREGSVCNVTATVMWAGMQLALQTSFVLAVQMLPVFTSVSLLLSCFPDSYLCRWLSYYVLHSA